MQNSVRYTLKPPFSAVFEQAERYAQLLRSPAAVAEAGFRPPPCSERHLQCVWQDPRLRPEKLITTDGECVQVESAGSWNLEAGPDFTDAVLRIGPERRRICGDLEIHLHPNDWYHHGHAKDPRYRNVRFHLVWQTALRPHPQNTLIEIPLAEALQARAGFHFENIDLSAYPYAARPADTRCFPVLRDAAPELKTALLEAAGEERLRRKTEQFSDRIRQVGAPQALYEGLMTGLGYKHNKMAFRELAQRVPLHRLQKETDGVEEAYAVLAGTAGLLPRQPKSGMDAAARKELKKLWSLWFKQRQRWTPEAEKPLPWRLAGVRPANHPARRLAAAAVWFNRDSDFFEQLHQAAEDPGRDPQTLIALLTQTVHPFWSSRSSWQQPPGRHPTALVGPARSRTLLINTLLPWLIATGAPPDPLLNPLPTEPLNRVIRETAFRLLGPDAPPSLYRSGKARQGLIQIHHDFCLNVKNACADCLLPERLHRALHEKMRNG